MKNLAVIKVSDTPKPTWNENVEILSREISLVTAKKAFLKRQVVKINENRMLSRLQVERLLDEVFYDVFHNIDTWPDFEQMCFKYFEREIESFKDCVLGLMHYVWLRRKDEE